MRTDEYATLAALENGVIEIRGEFLWGSNYTFLVNVKHNHEIFQAVYKPSRGIRPLWDFPKESLPRREVASYLVSRALGWDLVPPTAYRTDAALGPGSLQCFVEHDPEYHYFNFDPGDVQRLRPTAVFDILINNADRKGSHIIFDPDDRLWLIDHGICFHKINKLRTVVWDFMGEKIPDDMLNDLINLQDQLIRNDGVVSSFEDDLKQHISSEEIMAFKERLVDLVQTSCFPAPDPERRHYPWPQI